MCRNAKPQSNTNPAVVNQDSHKNTKHIQLPDSLFALKDLNNVNMKFIWDSGLYINMPNKIWFKALDSIQEMQLLGLDSEEVQLTSAYFISKQKKIGTLQPIIICQWGDEFWSTDLIILDSNNIPVSDFPLHMESAHGPDSVIGDSIDLYGGIKQYAEIDSNTIKWSELTVYKKDNDSITPETIDSIGYISTILPNGTITTKRTDSTRYKRKLSDSDYFQEL